mmetsp:Transcript_10878/g.9597  ORF Transcript_10878/g.9597 Transcript_10878/m.9597 type:complete len:81 (+) Transcript_10878:513-755(+)
MSDILDVVLRREKNNKVKENITQISENLKKIINENKMLYDCDFKDVIKNIAKIEEDCIKRVKELIREAWITATSAVENYK